MMLLQDGIENARTKAELRRAVLRTAALTHWRHDFTQRLAPTGPHTSGDSRRAASPCPAGFVASGEPAERFPVPSFHPNTIA